MEQKKDGLAVCGGCTHHDKDTQHQPVPYIVHERDMARQERTIRRLWFLCVLMFLAFAASNAAWVWYESQFEDVVTTIDAQQDGSGTNIVGGGDVDYEPTSEDNKKD